MRVLVVGSGAREHALVAALAADPAVRFLACAPGNAGTAAIAEPHPLDVDDPAAVAALAGRLGVDLVVIGPEAPLVAGAADAVRAAGIACFGPSAAAARIEGSKAFAKDVMAAAGVPTAAAVLCATIDEVDAALGRTSAPYVVKDDGLAAGKGVVVTEDVDAARAHAQRCLGSGRAVLIEEYLDGPEVSLLYLVDGQAMVPLLPAQDFKRLGDGDTGPNTGGVGAYCPLPWAPADLADDILRRVVRPTMDELARRDSTFAGVLYVGLALTSAGPRVVEFNARFGDPETQVVLALLETPLAGLLYAAATGRLAEQPPPRWSDGAAVTVVMAAAGYPQAPRTGDRVSGADLPGVLHAGTRRADDGSVLATGGRVLSVLGTGTDLAAARAAAYDLVGRVELAGAQWRSDIALRAAAESVG